MPETFIALLYSIGIGGGRRLPMKDYREMIEAAGFKNARTLIATGNALFESESADVAEIERRLEQAFALRFGRHVDTLVIKAAAFKRLIAGNPFSAESSENGSMVHVKVMRKPLPKSWEHDLERYLVQGERVKIVRGHLWVHFKNQPVRSRLLPVLGSKRLGIGTVRNWNTMRRLGEMLEAD